MDSDHNQTSHILSFLAVVNQLHRLVSNPRDSTLPQGMTISQLSAIAFLYFRQEKETYQKDLETCFKLRRSSVSSLLNTLEKKGFLQRVSVPHDARLKKLVLTQEAKEIGTCIHEAFAGLDRRMFQGITPEELTTLDTVLSKIQRNLNSIDTCSHGGTP